MPASIDPLNEAPTPALAVMAICANNVVEQRTGRSGAVLAAQASRQI